MSRDRIADRQRFSDPDFNKWLDDGISDAGHTVWDAIPDIGSAWNGWDAAKAALGYYCDECGGSGEHIHISYRGPDSFERLGDCPACDGDGRSSEALRVSKENCQRLLDAAAEDLTEIWKLKAENEALRQDAERYRYLRDGPHDLDLSGADSMEEIDKAIDQARQGCEAVDFNMEQMDKSLAGKRFTMPEGMTREKFREWMLDNASSLSGGIRLKLELDRLDAENEALRALPMIVVNEYTELALAAKGLKTSDRYIQKANGAMDVHERMQKVKV